MSKSAFRGSCDLRVGKTATELSPEEWALTSELERNWVHNRGVNKIDVHQHFETDDAKTFDEHMRNVHGKRKLRAGIPKPWRVPSLKEEGRPFEPTDFQVGAEVEWEELDPVVVQRRGQVWSAGPERFSVWVIPFDPHAGEMAVMLRRFTKDGPVHCQRSLFRRDAA